MRLDRQFSPYNHLFLSLIVAGLWSPQSEAASTGLRSLTSFGQIRRDSEQGALEDGISSYVLDGLSRKPTERTRRQSGNGPRKYTFDVKYADV